MSDAETVESMLETFKTIKSEQDASTEDESAQSSPGNGDCSNCGSENTKREVAPGNGANRTASRYVGGQNMRVQHVCRDCGHRWF